MKHIKDTSLALINGVPIKTIVAYDEGKHIAICEDYVCYHNEGNGWEKIKDKYDAR